MIYEYSNEMKKNLEEIGALSHEEVKELIFSELRELGNFLKKLEKDFEWVLVKGKENAVEWFK